MFSANLPHKSLRVKGELLSLEKPIVMGILNITPDSFFDGGKYQATESALARAQEMINEGAKIIDIGAMSSKPGSKISDVDEETALVCTIVEAILKHNPNSILSIDTLHSQVAEAALQSGAAIINDISGATFDPKMLDVVARWKAPLIIMHMKGLPENMQINPEYEDVLLEVMDFFIERIDAATQSGIADIVLDPGFGFGKTTEHNFELLQKMNAFSHLDKPVLAGLSRKSMIWKTLNANPQQALNGTTALNMAALQHGASILRVHDVKEALEVVQLFNMLQGCR